MSPTLFLPHQHTIVQSGPSNRCLFFEALLKDLITFIKGFNILIKGFNILKDLITFIKIFNKESDKYIKYFFN